MRAAIASLITALLVADGVGAGEAPRTPTGTASVPPERAAATARLGNWCIAVVGDVQSDRDLAAIRRAVGKLCGDATPAEARPDGIEVVTNIALGPDYDRFALFDGIVALAKERHLPLVLRIKPRVAIASAREVVRETREGVKPAEKTTDQPSLLDPVYQEAVRRYFAAVATRYAHEPLLASLVVGICIQGETQYVIDGCMSGDFAAPALADWQQWMQAAGAGADAPWPRLAQPILAANTRLARDTAVWHLGWWRARRLADLVGASARAIHAVAPHLPVGTFSYIGLNAAAGYAPGFLDDDPDIDWYFSSITLHHGLCEPRDRDRSRPVVNGRGAKLQVVEFDLISAYTDPAHAETFARTMCLMRGQPRPFLPRWWGPDMKGGWAAGHWTRYSDGLARDMIREAKAALPLRSDASVADVAVVVPNVGVYGVMANWGPWTSDEFKWSHGEVVRHLQGIGANFDVLTEDGLSATMLTGYRLVVVLGPALYPSVRTALEGCTADILALGWAGTVVVPPPGKGPAANAWYDEQGSSWWPTGGTAERTAPTVRFTDRPELGALRGRTVAYAKPAAKVPHLTGLKGIPLALDGQGRAVAAVMPWGARRVWHVALPARLAAAGTLLDDAAMGLLLDGILRACGCTSYGDLGPLRLYETDRHLLVENPAGTTGTVAEPQGGFAGVLPVRTRNPPPRHRLDGEGRLRLEIPAGASVVIPLGSGP